MPWMDCVDAYVVCTIINMYVVPKEAGMLLGVSVTGNNPSDRQCNLCPNDILRSKLDQPVLLHSSQP